eukprot:5294293-Amphidinium_carterae.1
MASPAGAWIGTELCKNIELSRACGASAKTLQRGACVWSLHASCASCRRPAFSKVFVTPPSTQEVARLKCLNLRFSQHLLAAMFSCNGQRQLWNAQ